MCLGRSGHSPLCPGENPASWRTPTRPEPREENSVVSGFRNRVLGAALFCGFQRRVRPDLFNIRIGAQALSCQRYELVGLAVVRPPLWG